MFDNDGGSSTETTRRAETGGDGSNQHIDLGGGDIIKLGETTTGTSNGSEREGFVENESILVFMLEFDLWHGFSQRIIRSTWYAVYQFRQVGHRTVAFENSLGDDEPTCQWSPTLSSLLVNAFQDLLKALHVVMVEPADCAARYLEALLNREVDVPVCNDDISSLGEGRNDGRNCREGLGVENGVFCPEEICNILLEFGVNVDRAIETRRTTTSETVFPQGLSSLLFDAFVAGETGEIEACEVHDGLSGADEFGFGTSWTRDDGKRGEIQTLSFGEGLFEGFGSPFVNEFIDFLDVTNRSARPPWPS